MGRLVQLAERLTVAQEVDGSNPSTPPFVLILQGNQQQNTIVSIDKSYVDGLSPSVHNACSSIDRTKNPYIIWFPITSGNSSVGRALASQAKGRGFESRLPLNGPMMKLGRHKGLKIL